MAAVRAVGCITCIVQKANVLPKAPRLVDSRKQQLLSCKYNLKSGSFSYQPHAATPWGQQTALTPDGHSLFLSKNLHFGKVSARAMASASSKAVDGPVVSPDWLKENLNDVKVLDASWYMPAEKRDTFSEYQAARIPGAIFFDLNRLSDPTSDLPHMLPTEQAFAAAASALGLASGDSLVVYDSKGLFSAARVWWTFRVFGHDKVWVLEGGLPAWQGRGYPLETRPSEEGQQKTLAAVESVAAAYRTPPAQGEGPATGGSFQAKLQPHLIKALPQVLENVEAEGFQLIDARPKPRLVNPPLRQGGTDLLTLHGQGRFDGVQSEPRAGVRGGHVPGSQSIPFPQVLKPDGSLKPEDELRQVFASAGVKEGRPIVASCGTGVTACILALALHKIGKPDVAVYDGSWTEWGLSSETPVESSADNA
eukprot:jgi/Mesen1/566/ME000107S10805